MKESIVCLLVSVLLGNISLGQVPGARDLDASRWVEEHFAKGKIPPFSFVFNGQESGSFITKWKYGQEKGEKDKSGKQEYVYTYSDKKSGLVVKCTVHLYDDFPAVDWLVRFCNCSGENSGVLEKVAVIDQRFRSERQGNFIFHHSLGSTGSRTDFMPFDEALEENKEFYLSPVEGRSSGRNAFPFFNIEFPGHKGIIAAVGWSGKWYASIKREDAHEVALRSGMEEIKMFLYPGEEIRSPAICLLFWDGEDPMAGNNLFRRFVLSHRSRMINGRFAELPLAVGLGYGGPYPCNEYNCLNESYAIALADRFRQFSLQPEVMWIDAGWYKGCGQWWANVGNWEVNKDRFPEGLKPVSDAVHRAGAGLLVWFEPERVRDGTDIAREHPEWIIKRNGSPDYLFDLGNKEARLWLTDYITALIKREGIDHYRQDFNMDPMPYWRANDPKGRTGITEIRHVEGLYAYWDSLLVRFPNLIIDNCASGGRRLDFETICRSSPLWRTDYQYGEPNGYQCHTYGLNYYLPLHGTGNYLLSPYTFRSSMSSAIVLNWDINSSSGSIPEMQKYMHEFKRLRPYYYGDYYPLSGIKDLTGDHIWLAYQLNRPENQDGLVMVFRREKALEETITLQLHGLEQGDDYELYYEDYGVKSIKKGSELMDGLAVTISSRPSSLLISYKRHISE